MCTIDGKGVSLHTFGLDIHTKRFDMVQQPKVLFKKCPHIELSLNS